MELNDEILVKNGYKIQEGLNFPFDMTPLYENEEHSVYIIDTLVAKPKWLFGLNDNSKEGEGDTIEDFNDFLRANNKPELVV